MNKKLFIGFLLCMMFLSFVSSQTDRAYCIDNGIGILYKDQPTLKQDTNFTFSFHIYNSTNGQPLTNSSAFCAFHLYDSSGEHLIQESNIQFGVNDYDFFQDALGSNFSNGEYSFVVACFDNAPISESGGCSDFFNVTSNGEEQTYSYLIATVVLILTFLGIGILIHIDRAKMSDEKYWSSMFNKWANKNYLRFAAVALWYNLKKNCYVLYYLIGFMIMLMVYDISLFYNLVSVSPILSIMLSLYTWGSLFVVIVFFGSVQEWIKDWIDKLQKINWEGIVKSG